MKRAALYARVSTSNHHQDPELQLRELRAFCRQRGLTIIKEYVDRVSSSKVRPEQEKMLSDATEHLFDVVLVWKFDRFARSAIELNLALEKLKALNIGFVSYTEQIDTSTAAGELVLTILGAVAKMEREMIRERVRAGLRNTRARGTKLGRPRCKLSPQTVALAVDNHGTVKLAARALGISYGTAYVLNHRARRL